MSFQQARADFVPGLTPSLQRLVDMNLVVGASLELHAPEGRATAVVGERLARSGQPLTPASGFPVAGGIKMLVSAVYLDLVDKGLVSLDTDILEYLPELASDGADVSITPRHLLSHTAGFKEPRRGEWARSWSDFCAYYRGREQIFSPGSVWSYSDVGHQILARIAERASGVPMGKMLDDAFFSPIVAARSVAKLDRVSATPGHVPSISTFRFEPARPISSPGLLGNSISDRLLTPYDAVELSLMLSERIRDPMRPSSALLIAPQVKVQKPLGKERDDNLITAFGLGCGVYGRYAGYNCFGSGTALLIRFDPSLMCAVALASNVANPMIKDQLVMELIRAVSSDFSATLNKGRQPEINFESLSGEYRGLGRTTESVSIAASGMNLVCSIPTPSGRERVTLVRNSRGGLALGSSVGSLELAVFQSDDCESPVLRVNNRAFRRM